MALNESGMGWPGSAKAAGFTVDDVAKYNDNPVYASYNLSLGFKEAGFEAQDFDSAANAKDAGYDFDEIWAAKSEAEFTDSDVTGAFQGREQ